MEAAVAERLAPPAPAAGYRIRPFAPGDERHWARIETSVGEFPDEAAARAYFERVYLPEAALRCLFVVTEQDEPVATATTWTEEEASLRQLQLQWVAVEPAHQGRGLGRAIATAAVRRAVRLAPGEAILAAYADMEPPGAAALPQPRIPLLPHADDRHAEQGGDGYEALPQRIRRGDGGIAPHGRPRRDRRMAPHGVPVIGRIGYSSGVSM